MKLLLAIKKIFTILGVIIAIPIAIIVGLVLLAIIAAAWYAIIGIVVFCFLVVVAHELWRKRNG